MTMDGQDKYTAAYSYGLERIKVEAPDNTRPDSQVSLYYLHDGLGSTKQLVRSNGAVRDHYNYDEFGDTIGAKLSEDGRNVNHNTFGYTGELWDEEDDLLYLRSRYYAPQIGRFMTRDTFPGYAVNPLSIHKYAYVENSPVNFVDPLGFSSKPISYGIYKIGNPTQPEWKEGKQYDEDFKYDPNAKATFEDYQNWAEWGTKAAGAGMLSYLSLYNLTDAVDAYVHYRSAQGTNLTIDYEKAYTEDDYIRNSVNKHIVDAQKAAQELYKLSGQKSFKMTGQLVSVGSDGYPVTENWQKAIGAHWIWISADVTVNSSGQFKMTTTVHEIDRYNFNKGMQDVATGTPDEINGRFAVLGWAKSFNTVGQMVRDVTWTNGKISNSTTIEKPGGRCK